MARISRAFYRQLPAIAEEPKLSQPQTMMSREDIKLALGGVCTATLYNMINRGEFPRPVKIGSRSFWLSSDYDDFVASLAEKRRRK